VCSGPKCITLIFVSRDEKQRGTGGRAAAEAEPDVDAGQPPGKKFRADLDGVEDAEEGPGGLAGLLSGYGSDDDSP
jgi:hypothetical protein